MKLLKNPPSRYKHSYMEFFNGFLKIFMHLIDLSSLHNIDPEFKYYSLTWRKDIKS